MRNLKLIISYDGSQFSGYQKQPHTHNTAQAWIEKAWGILSREQDFHIIGCSRLDAGVSAYRYHFNVKTGLKYGEEKILRSLNGILHTHLQQPICVYEVKEVGLDFHARKNAVSKHYRYLLWQGFALNQHYLKRTWCIRHPKILHPDPLNTIFRQYEGVHDFAAFRSQDCQAPYTQKHILQCHVWKKSHLPQLTIIDVWGDGFLKQMVRNMVGTAVAMGTQTLPDDTIQRAYEHKSRPLTGPCAPAQGLMLMDVLYDTKPKL